MIIMNSEEVRMLTFGSMLSMPGKGGRGKRGALRWCSGMDNFKPSSSGFGVWTLCTYIHIKSEIFLMKRLER